MSRTSSILRTTINGRPVRPDQAKISVLDNSLLYAEGLFESFLAVNHRIWFLKEHLARTRRTARVIGLPLPVGQQTLTRWLQEAVNSHPAQIKKVRMTITSGESERWAGRTTIPSVIISVGPHTLPTKPFDLWVSDFHVDQTSIFRRIKTISYAINAAALRHARHRGYDDALLLNCQGKVAEVTSANIFWAKDERLFTPTLHSGCLEGVTRKAVLREARRLDIAVTEKDVDLETVLEADEIFITSSLKLIIGVHRIRWGRRVVSLPPGPITAQLRRRFLQVAAIPTSESFI